MDAVFTLVFTPESDDNGDQICDVLVQTDREEFVVPVIAYGRRAILDFPDKVSFMDSPVRFSSTRTLLVRNIGMSVGILSCSAASRQAGCKI